MVQQRIYKILVKDRLKKISAEDWEELEEITYSTIRIYLAYQILYEISNEITVKGLWKKLQNT